MAKGRHIKVARWQGIYYHHGIDRGDGTVIHYSGEVASKQDASIRQDTMATFLDGGRMETCDHYEALFTPDEIIQRAESRIGEKAYGLYGNNCEHFARWCRTNEHLSEQVERAKQTLTEIAVEGVSKGTQKVLVTYVNSEKVPFLNSKKAGQLERYGSILRLRTQSGGVHHILREGLSKSGNNPLMTSKLLQQTLQMSSVAAAASVLNLGVSIAGFAYLSYQMSQLKQSLSQVERTLEQGFQNMGQRFDSVELRLEDIYLLSAGNQALSKEILYEVQALRDEFFEQQRGRLLAALEMARLNPATHTDNLRVFKETKFGLEDGLLRNLQRQNLREVVGLSGRFRLWSIATAAEGQSLLEMEHLHEAEQLFRSAANHSFACAEQWLTSILDGRSWGLFGHSKFGDLIQEERLRRIAALAEGKSLSTTEYLSSKSTGAQAGDGFLQRLSESELQQYAGFAALIDLAIEIGQRFDSKAWECELCRNHGWTIEQWFQLGRDSDAPLLLTIPTETKKNRWS
ncbi:MAG: hypothetical protein EP343_34670 [Deltaproteobacteria bacterium]|nr:MAG: hypothetical protein EP343_34670 [Deltaproteobacteria bacterium]